MCDLPYNSQTLLEHWWNVTFLGSKGWIILLSNKNIFIFLKITLGTSNSEAESISLIKDFEVSDQRSKNIILIRSVLKFISYIEYLFVVWAHFPMSFFQGISYAAFVSYGFLVVALGDWSSRLCSAKTYIQVYAGVLRYEIERHYILSI